jgi:glycosyltransferase involved in cell wall biosynthesis
MQISNMTPKVSIIIPVYNVEKYLRECLDSVIAQTFTDWECILVDDGSKDTSPVICDEYAKRDNRFRVIHKGNGGASLARNIGIDNAHGDWITFVDSDDWLSEDYLAHLCRFADLPGDLICSSWAEAYADRTCINQVPDETFNRGDFHKLFEDPAYFKLLKGPYCKLYRTDVIRQHNLRFNEKMAFMEDREFVLRFLLCSQNVVMTNYCDYYYRQLLTSLIHRTHSYESEFAGYLAFAHLIKQINDNIKINEDGQHQLLVAVPVLTHRVISAIKCSFPRKIRNLKMDMMDWKLYNLSYKPVTIKSMIAKRLLTAKLFNLYWFLT